MFSVTFDCPNGLEVTIECSGAFSGEASRQCPYYIPVPVCLRLDETGAVVSTFEPTTYTDTTTQCDITSSSTADYVHVVAASSTSLYSPETVNTKKKLDWRMVVSVVIVVPFGLLIIGCILRYLHKKEHKQQKPTKTRTTTASSRQREIIADTKSANADTVNVGADDLGSAVAEDVSESSVQIGDGGDGGDGGGGGGGGGGSEQISGLARIDPSEWGMGYPQGPRLAHGAVIPAAEAPAAAASAGDAPEAVNVDEWLRGSLFYDLLYPSQEKIAYNIEEEERDDDEEEGIKQNRSIPMVGEWFCV